MKKKSDIEKLVAALPDSPKKARKWSLEEDAALVKYAESKGVSAIARALGVPPETARRRYQLLKGKLGGK